MVVTWCSKPVLVGGFIIVKGQEQGVDGGTEKPSQEDVEGQVEQKDQACECRHTVYSNISLSLLFIVEVI